MIGDSHGEREDRLPPPSPHTHTLLVTSLFRVTQRTGLTQPDVWPKRIVLMFSWLAWERCADVGGKGNHIASSLMNLTWNILGWSEFEGKVAETHLAGCDS